MASSYSTDLKLELMVTGENAGTWGDKTNTNLNLIQQAVSGYQAVSIAGGAQTTALAMTNATLSNARNNVISLTGTITGNQIVTIPDGINKSYIIINNTTGAFTVQFKTVSGTGFTWGTTDKSARALYADGTNINDVGFDSLTGVQTLTNKTLASPVITTAATLNAQGELRLADADSSNYVGLKSGTTVNTNIVWTLPTSDGTANQVLTTNGSGTLSFATVSGGAAWQAVQTGNFNATVKYGYFVNTSSAAVTATLPASPTLGDFISFIDYSGTFQTNNFTVSRNGNPIQGSATDLTVATQRAGFTLVYVDSTQGWLLQNN